MITLCYSAGNYFIYGLILFVECIMLDLLSGLSIILNELAMPGTTLYLARQPCHRHRTLKLSCGSYCLFR